MAEKSRATSLAGRDVAPLPAIADAKRRVKCRDSLLEFCLTYFKRKFDKPFGANHFTLISRLENLIKNGGRQSIAMPRGTGKTTIVIVSAIWALVNGFRKFLVIVAGNTKEARKILSSIHKSLKNNKELAEDYPEVCVPLRALGNSSLLARGQNFYGVPTSITISSDQLILPTIPESPSSGSVVACFGIKSNIRGQNFEGPKGETYRPDFVFLDDLQNNDVARNPKRIELFESIINATIAGLAADGSDLSMVQTCTVLETGDLADRYLDKEIYPQWNGMRCSAIEVWPNDMGLWREYRYIRATNPDEATKFYKQNLEEMRAGAVVSWPESYNKDVAIDALQYNLDKWCDYERGFMAEQQNQPLAIGSGAVKVPAKEIVKKLNGLKRGTLPANTLKLTGFIDVHYNVLYWSVVAWTDGFTAHVVDYGTFPEQVKRYFKKDDGGTKALKEIFPNNTADGRLFLGLDYIFKDFLSRSYSDEKGVRLKLDRVLVDSKFKPEVVENALVKVPTGILYQSKGASIKATSAPISAWPKKPSRIFGFHWIDERPDGRALRSVLVDTNYWKTKVHESFSLTPGEAGACSLYGKNQVEHRLFAEHCAAEDVALVSSGENEVNQWTQKPTNPDNHYFDCLVGNYVAASTLGLLTQDDYRSNEYVKRKRKC